MYLPIHPKGRGRYGNNYWEVYSPKLKRIVKLYSDLEYDHWLLVEVNPKIINFCEQPKEIVCYQNGERFKSIFDMWIKQSDGFEVFIEVKYERDLDPLNPNSSRAIKQTTIQRSWCQDNCFNYEIRTETVIRSNKVLIANAKHLLPYLRNREHPIDTDAYRVTNLAKNGPITLEKVFSRLSSLPQNRIEEAVYRLVFEGKMNSNISTVPIGPQTEVWVSDEKQVN